MVKISRYIVLGLFFLIAIQIQKSNASDRGGDISYIHLGGGEYQININVYLDCAGAGFVSQPIYIIDGSYKHIISGSVCCGKDMTPVGNNCSLCTDASCSFHFGIQKWFVTAKADFSKYSACKFIIYSDEGKLDTATNTTRPATYYNYNHLECTLDRCHIDQNSPVFQLNPILLLCNKQAVNAFQYADAGNQQDSLVLSQVAIQDGFGGYIGYTGSFNKDLPLSFTGSSASASPPNGFHFNPGTGELNFTPKIIESSYISFQADEYKKINGTYYFVGSALRTSLVNIIDCNTNHSPVISPVNGSASDTLFTCANVPVSFKIYTSDTDKNDVVSVSAVNETGGKISISSDPKPVITFTWTPKNKDVSPVPWFFTVLATDRGQPVVGQSQKRFYIKVLDSTPVTNIKTVDNGCGKYHFSVLPVPDINYNITYKWMYDSSFISSSPDFNYTNTLAGKHAVTLIITNLNSACAEYLSDTIYYDAAYHKLPPQYGICKGVIVQLHAAKANNLVWSPAKGLSDIHIENPYANPDTTTIYTLTANDGAGCVYTDKIKLTVNDFKIATSGNKAICQGSSTKLYINKIPGAVIAWSPSSGLNASKGDTVIGSPNQTTTYTISADLYGCVKKDSILLKIHQSGNILKSDTDACINDTVTIQAKGGTSYKWYNLSNPKIILGTDSVYKFKVINTSLGYRILVTMVNKQTGCLDSGNMIVHVHAFNPSWAKASGNICKGETLKYTATGGQAYLWQVPGFGTSSLNYIAFQPKSSTFISLTISDIFCAKTYSIPVYVPPASTTYPAVTICKGDSILISEHGGSVYTWSPNAGIANIHAASQFVFPAGTTTYSVLVTDSAAYCARNDLFKVNVLGDCVWPGDANRDGAANYLDVLNIGLNFGAKGTARAPGTTHWKPYTTTDWPGFKNGINDKHADCNGDGVVDARDTAIISANYHKKINSTVTNPADPPLYFKFTQDTFYSGGTVTAYVYAGEKDNLLARAYGIGYQPSYSVKPLVDGTVVFSPYCEYFCTGSEINYIKQDDAANNIDAAVVETNGKNTANTFGRIGVITFKLKDSLKYKYNNGPGELIYCRIASAKAVDSAGRELKIFPTSSTALVLKRRKNHIIADFVSGRSGCEPLTTKFKNLSSDSGGNIISYDWDFGDGSPHSQDISPTHTYRISDGTQIQVFNVKLTLRDDFGYRAEVNKIKWIVLLQNPLPRISANPGLTTLDDPTIQFYLSQQSKNIDTTSISTLYNWYFGDFNNPDSGGHSNLKDPAYTYSDTGQYGVKLIVTNGLGCHGIDSEANLFYIKNGFAVFVPNVFIPNGRAKNRIFKAVVSACASYQVEVYDRWDRLIFHSNDPNEGWDGYFEGNQVQEGVYRYFITAVNLAGKTYKYKGNISLMR